MIRRSGWFWLAIILPAYLGYQVLAHRVITDDHTALVRFGFAAASGVPHALINVALLWFFGRTLRAGREPLITRFARRIHGTIPPGIEGYTRRVTVAWCVFFAGQIIVSVALFAWSLEAWSVFVNFVAAPSIVLMFLVEYAYRLMRHRDFPHASILDGMKAFSDDARRRSHG